LIKFFSLLRGANLKGETNFLIKYFLAKNPQKAKKKKKQEKKKQR